MSEEGSNEQYLKTARESQRDKMDLSAPHIDGAVSGRGVNVAVPTPLHTADSLGVARHGEEASPGVCIPHLKPVRQGVRKTITDWQMMSAGNAAMQKRGKAYA